MWKKLSIQKKIILPILAVSLFSFAGMLGFLISKARSLSIDEAFDKSAEQAYRYGATCQSWLEVAMDATRTLAQTFEGLKQSGVTPDRAVMDAMLKQVLNANPGFLGIWTCWEPNALDGKDAEYTNALGHDATGRYIPYWNRASGEIAVEPLMNYEKPGDGDYYLLCRNSGEETILNPYRYTVGGKEVLLTSVVAPVVVDGRVAGAVGIDMTLEYLAEIVKNVKPYGTGYAFMTANDGTFVAHLKEDILGKKLSDAGAPAYVQDAVRAGKETTEDRVSLATGIRSRTVFVPVTIGQTKTFWCFGVSIPMDKVMAHAREMTIVGTIIGIAALLILVAVIVAVSRSISRPLVRLTTGAQAIANGRLDVDLKHDSQDELGHLSQALHEMAQKFFMYVSSLDAVPFPISVTDVNMNWLFINKAVESVTGLKRADVLGKPCSNWNADICKTKNCGIECLRRGQKTSVFQQPGVDADFQVDTAYMHNVKGETIGHIEIVQDISRMSRAAKYNEQEIVRLAGNLDMLSRGNLEMNLLQTEADKYTQEDSARFTKINENLKQVRQVINTLSTHAELLSKSAMEGRLRTRAETMGLQGAYRNIVVGVNQTLDSIVACLDAIPMPLQFMDTNYKVQFLNATAERLLGKETRDAARNTCAELWSTEKCRTKECPCHVTMEQNAVYTCENTCSVAGARLDLNCVGAPLHDASGKVIGSFEFVIDQTDMKNMLRKSQKQAGYQTAEVKKLAANLQLLANGDFNVAPETAEADNDTAEVRELFVMINESLMEACQRLNDALVQVAEAVMQVNSGAEQISDASQSLSQGATEQASSLEEITSSITEIASQTKTNAENANQANSLAGKVRQVAEKGSGQMSQMVESMESINASSAQIAKIIKVIDDIAFQTNLLALNAAVEAARAGRHGKGFAVVADEVRNLAGRSAKAAKETAELIESSGAKTQAGMQVANATAESFKDIVDGIVKTNDLVGEIAAASSEQAQGVSQINLGLSQVDQVTQQNTANAEETASAAEELSSQATHLQGLIAKFNLRNQEARLLPSKSADCITRNKDESERY